MSPCTLKLDEEKSKHAGLAQQAKWSLAQCFLTQFANKAGKRN
jgi:hypothetical protein